MGCCGSTESKRDWNPLQERSCTDIPWLIFFSLFCVGMACICGFTIVTGATTRLVYGYDSYGNVCGHNNTKIQGVELSGRNMLDNKYVFFLDPCNIDFINRKMKSISLCVAKCPDAELKTHNDLKQFALNNGSALCSYDVTPSRYTSHSERLTKCPKLPVSRSKSVSLSHRCVPVNISCYAELALSFFNLVSDNNVVRRVVAGVMASKDIIVGLCVLSLVLSLLMMVVIRYISKVMVWIITILTVIGTIVGTGVLWWLYADHRKALKNNTASVFGREVASDNVKALLVYAIFATVFTVVLLLVMVIMRKRVALTISLFHVAGKVFIHIPLLVLQPFWTFLCLMLFWVYWLAVLLLLGMSGSAVKNNSTNLVEYQISGPAQYLVWYHAVGLIWISEFIFAFQQMSIAGAVVTYYFTRDKSRLPATPILSAMLRTLRYHLGTLAKGSFIITLVKIPRIILMYIHSKLKGKENACARCMIKCCVCCLWCLEKCLAYLNQNAYTATAINSTNFCTSARDAFTILVENALRVAALNTVGDFVLFLAKVLVVACSAFAGVLALNYQREYTVWVLPLLIICLFAYMVAHCFLSVFENVVDVLFLCFAVDSKYNNGSPGREYFMDKSLMEFVENSKKSSRHTAEDGSGREMKPMAQ
ncbi:choline transporter-like protein 1 isoform X2 [Nerophis lumbriciformis]|uniref:choline transporter-like protein 1 isoform X1 n=1 Tax=Nerophis lumbriciformis TaxID=546530 RepID=UPI002ADF34A3|nr:choline transporter-like protein 1 isoform X1 [Nerophis lumbriciformis]XP_061840379.1 choline transporter-like protein 1 isoform X2 [Nerophis lumbriciformis]